MGKAETQKLSGQASDVQISMWKNLHRDVFEVKASDKVGYFKRPDRNTIKAATAISAQDGHKANEIVLENCWLGGDPEIKTNDLYYMEVAPIIPKLFDFGKAEIKKL
jgi:hypothetical protein